VKVIIAGSRDYTDYALVKNAVTAIANESDLKITEIVSGGARGVDALGERYAREHNFPCNRFPADWNQYGLSAGPRRNQEMARHGDVLIAFTSGGPGTTNMIQAMRRTGKPVFIVNL
jgi:hypothetical protein